MSSIFFENLKKIRENHSLTLKEMSDNIGLSDRLIETYEFRKIFPPFKNLTKITDYYGVTIDYLLFGEASEYIKNLKLFILAKEMNNLSHNERGKIEDFIDTFIDNKKKILRHYDKSEYDFTDNFNENFKQLLVKNNITENEMAKKLDLTKRKIASYKKETECSYETLIKISNLFNISIHWLLTGIKLSFTYNDRDFEKQLFFADQYFDTEKMKITIEYMKKILKSKGKEIPT